MLTLKNAEWILNGNLMCISYLFNIDSMIIELFS